ncbi:MAG: restriction endonuclease subunit S [Desulfuromonadales bacterium]|nr:restriction endonuclease subunit S [Desulfuromonadales bacterium]
MANKWIEVRIGDLGRVVTGKTPPSSRPLCFGGDYPFITPTDMKGQKFARQTDRYLSEEGALLLKRNLIPPGSVAVSCIGWQMGKAIKTCYPSFTNQQLNTIIPNEKVDPSFLYYSLSTRQRELLSLGSATGVRTPILNKSSFSDLKIVLPPLETQRKIASILSAYDDLIENNTRRIKILEEMAQTIYREWFVNFRFPGHEKVKMVDSSLGKIPEGWEVGRLDDALVLQRGFDLPKKKRDETGDVPIFAATGHNGIHSEAKVKAPGVVTGRSGSLGTVLYINEDFWPLNTTLWVKEFKKSTPAFAYYLLSGVELQKFNSGAAVPTLNRNDVHGLPTLLPPSSVLEIFDKHILPMFRLKKALSNKNQNLRQARDLLLPKLISGTIDVSELEVEIEAA